MFPEDVIFEEYVDDVQNDNFLDFNLTSLMFDFNKGEFVLMDGNPVIIDRDDAIRMWIYKNFRTRLHKYLIYENKVAIQREYGSDIIELVRGKKLPKVLLNAEIERDISEMCLENPYIRNIQDFDMVQEGHNVYIIFTVILHDYSEVEIQEVMSLS